MDGSTIDIKHQFHGLGIIVLPAKRKADEICILEELVIFNDGRSDSKLSHFQGSSKI